MGQRTYHNKLRRYQRLRQKQTEQQYEYLTERHIIRPAHPKYAVVNHHALKDVACEQTPFWWVLEPQFA